MANSTSNLDLISSSQSAKEITANALFDAGSTGLLMGRRASTTSALTWGYYGGASVVGGVPTIIANGTIALTASATNYLELRNSDGVVVKNTTAWTGAGYTPLYKVVTGTATVTSYEDYRSFVALSAVPQTMVIPIACSDETTALTAGTAKVTFRMPYAFTLSDVRASVTTAPTGSVLTVDINEAGTSILSTKLTIDADEKTSTTAATAVVISDTALADDAEITIDIDGVGSTGAGAGLKVYLIGVKA